MSGKQKALLILLAVALVVLFVIAVGANAGKQEGDAGQSNGFVDWLYKVGGRKSAVDPATVTADCATVPGDTTAYQFTGDCTLTVADPGSLRILKLTSEQPFHAKAPAPAGADMTLGANASPSATEFTAAIAVDKQTDVVVTCTAGLGQTCVVTVTAG